MNKKNEFGFSAVEVLLVILILVVIGGIGYMVYHNDHKTKTVVTSAKASSQKAPSTTSSSTNNQVTENSDNIARANDAKSLMTAFDNYLDNNEDSPPTTLAAGGASTAYLCASSTCDSTNSSVVQLDFYKPQNISIKINDDPRPLTVPNDNTVYIAGGVACVNDKAAAAEDASINSVIYAIQDGNSITQQCVSDS
jgi:hypothetical protein